MTERKPAFKRKAAKEQWGVEHDRALLAAIIAKVLAARRELYASLGLAGVADHGGERINKKIQARLRAMCGEHADIVDAEIQARKGAGAGAGAAGAGPAGAGPAGAKGRGKRARKEADEGGEGDEDEGDKGKSNMGSQIKTEPKETHTGVKRIKL